jgi:hypothetical protein
MYLDLIAALLAPIVTAIAGAVGILIRDRHDRRSGLGRRKYAMEDATRQVTFAAEWWKAKQALGCTPDDQAARAIAESWLAEATALVSESRQPPRRPESERSAVGRILLAYPFQRLSAKLLRVVYYLLLALTATLPLTAAWVGIEGDGIGESLGFAIFGMVVYTLPAFAIRAWAVAIETRAAARPGTTPSPEPVTRPTMLASGVTANHPGWYPDPVIKRERRYWDGRQWTVSASD